MVHPILKELMGQGLTIEMYIDCNGLVVVDLLTRMKSHCYLIFNDDGEIRAATRYDCGNHVIIEDINDVYEVVNGCRNGRPYMNEEWYNILDSQGYDVG